MALWCYTFSKYRESGVLNSSEKLSKVFVCLDKSLRKLHFPINVGLVIQRLRNLHLVLMVGDYFSSVEGQAQSAAG